MPSGDDHTKCITHLMVEQAINDLKASHRELSTSLSEHKEILTEHGMQIKQLDRQTMTVENLVQSISDLTVEIKVHTEKVSNVVTLVGDHENRIDELERGPRDNWNRLMYAVFAAMLLTVITSGITFAVTKFLEGGQQNEIKVLEEQVEKLRDVGSDLRDGTSASLSTD